MIKYKVFFFLTIVLTCSGQLRLLGDILSTTHEKIHSTAHDLAGSLLGGLSHGIKLNIEGHVGAHEQRRPDPGFHQKPHQNGYNPGPPGSQNVDKVIVIIKEEDNYNRRPEQPNRPPFNGYPPNNQRPNYDNSYGQGNYNNGQSNYDNSNGQGNYNNGQSNSDNSYGQGHYNNGQSNSGTSNGQGNYNNGQSNSDNSYGQGHYNNGQSNSGTSNGQGHYNNGQSNYGNPNNQGNNNQGHYGRPNGNNYNQNNNERPNNNPNNNFGNQNHYGTSNTPEKVTTKQPYDPPVETTTKKLDNDEPFFVPLSPDEYNYGGQKINITEPKREIDKDKQKQIEDGVGNLDIRFKDD
ncbi:probable serine/threonine-protein kinase clkA [Pieris napi]|uniref:probable serine/threonine-protein kinase clkA n=1 Tax=Pieris napi TaxID=78633 RepID=UPI001FBA418B|nr:probable serine/threonine-protein kinase clkA [Pieris napi]